ncbi:MAG: hypothetical protein SOZ82_04345 [Eubacteriales bacterium]|nr:hypothetical protein [Eubacteriales bacterium]
METKIIAQYEQAHNKLMTEWKSRHKAAGYKEFVTDGVVCPEVWFSQTTRVLYILKEPNNDNKGDGTDWNLPDYLNRPDGSKGRIWTAVAEWQYALQNTTADSIPAFDNWLCGPVGDMRKYREIQKNLLKQCAVLNIKKSNGRNPSDDIDLSRYVSEDGDLLKRQIAIISPTVIVCGSTFHLLKDGVGQSDKKRIFGEETSSFPDKGCFPVDGKIGIAYYHPVNRYPALLSYYGLAGMYHHCLKQTGKQDAEKEALV